MHRLKKSVEIGAIGVVVAVATVATVSGSAHLATSFPRSSHACAATQPRDHRVVIVNDNVSPQHTTAPLCDTITITNRDSQAKLIAFGPHDNHVAYDGVAERLLTAGQSLTIRLVQDGSFGFHDHIRDVAVGTFTVVRP